MPEVLPPIKIMNCTYCDTYENVMMPFGDGIPICRMCFYAVAIEGH